MKRWKRLLPYGKEDWKEALLAPLFKLLEAGLELLVPLVMADVIDRGIGQRDAGYIGKLGLCLLALAAVGFLASVTAQFFAAKAAVGFSARLRQALFNHIQGLDFTSLDRAGSSALMTRMTSDINQIQSGVNLALRLFLRSPVIVLGSMLMAFVIDKKSALLFAAVIPCLALAVFGVMAWTMPLYRKVQAQLDRVLGLTRENLSGVRVIRAFCREAQEEADFRVHTRALAAGQIFAGKINAVMNPVTYVIVNAAVIGLLYTGGLWVNAGSLTQGQVVALLNYMAQILAELVKLANLIVTVTRALACGDRVAAVFEIQNEPRPRSREPEKVPADAPFLEFDHVSLTYRDAGAEALRDISFRVKKGETVGVIGGTGSGKTSLVSLIAGFYPATAGAVRLEGRDVRQIPEKELKGRIGMAPQKAALFRGTIRSNLQWGKPDATQEEMWRAIDLAQAREVAEGKEGGLDAEITQNGKNLSGGQRQRLTIARALVRQPEILILDDSASALDYATDAALRSALESLKGKMTTFIVSQRVSAVRHADKILVLEDGGLAGAGTHEELMAHCGVYREIYDSQYA